MAAFLGTGPVAQAFLIAFTLPNMFRRFFAEGAFNLAFVPLFAKKVEAGEDAEGFARDALSGLGFVLIVFTIVGQIAMPWLVLAMASGFAGDERFTLSVEHGRIAFPYIILISLTALLSGVLNSLGRFALRRRRADPDERGDDRLPASAAGGRGGNIGLWQIWSVPVAGVAQLALVWWGCARAGMPILPRWPRLTPEMRRLTVIMVPGAPRRRRGADQPHRRPPGRLLLRRRRRLALLRRPALPAAARRRRHRHRRRAAARPLAPPRAPATARAAATRSTAPPSSPSP